MSEYKDVQLPFIKTLVANHNYRTLIPIEEMESYKDHNSLQSKQNPLIQELRDKDSNPLLTKIIIDSLLKLNTFLTEDDAKNIAKELLKLNKSQIQNNKQIHNYLANQGFSYKVNGENKTIKFIDFNNPENNDFLVIPEFYINGNVKCYIDCQIFLNGFPIVTKEDKNAGKFQDALSDLAYYADLNSQNKGCPKLFNYSLLLIASTGDICQYGTISGYPEHFTVWKDEDKKITIDQQTTLANEMLDPINLLDIIQNFILFNQDSIVSPKYYQYHAVKKVIDNLKGLRTNSLLFKTQGSGKTFDMAFIANYIRNDKELSKNKLLFLLDRQKLSDNVMGVLAHFLPTTDGVSPVKIASDGKQLEELLKSDNSDIIVALIQKTRSFDKFTNNSKDIIIISDEAHRTNHGTLKAILTKTIPNAVHVGMTGTPIDQTLFNYGKPLYAYTYLDSVEDETTVPIIYDGVKMNLSEHTNMIDIKEKSFFASVPDYMKDRLYKKNVNSKILESSEARIEMISFYIQEHFKSHLLNTPFKAMVRAESKESGLLYLKKLTESFSLDEDLKNIKIGFVISKEGNKAEGNNKEYEKYSDKEYVNKMMNEDFKKDLNTRILIVVDMGTTGYDVPAVSTLYNDKKISDNSCHGAFQWATRANRAFAYSDANGDYHKKDFGRFVDFANILGTLNLAIARYSDANLKGYDQSIKNIEILKIDAKNQFKTLKEYLKENDFKVIDEDKYSKLKNHYNNFSKTLEFLMPDKDAYQYIKEYKIITSEINKIRARRNADGEFAKYQLKYGPKIKEVAQDNIFVSGEGDVIVNGLDLFKGDLIAKDTLIKQMSAEDKALTFTNTMKSHIKRIVDIDPVGSQKLSERVDEILDRLKDKWSLLSVAMEELIKEVSNQTDEEKEFGIPMNKRSYYHSYKAILEIVKEKMNEERSIEFFEFMERFVSLYESNADLNVNQVAKDKLILSLSTEFRDEYVKNKEAIRKKWKDVQSEIIVFLNQMLKNVIKGI
jgi:type I restriction enzyme R subunit